MVRRTMVVGALALAVTGAVPAGALAKGGGGANNGGGGGGGGGGGKTAPVLPAPAIAPGTFDGIGPGPVYIHDSFGWAQTTRLAKDGSVVSVLDKPEINGIRAEFPNNATETWLEPETRGAPSWRLTSISTDPFEPATPLQASAAGTIDGALAMVGADPSTDTQPAALLPFAAPADSPSTVSADIADFRGGTAIGFTSSSAATRNFETGGQAWLELDSSGIVAPTSDTVLTWTFHTGGKGATTLSGDYDLTMSGVNQAAISYDPVHHVAAAMINGQVVASAPDVAAPIKYVGVEGSLNGNVNNFTVRAGTVTDPAPAS